MHSLAMQSSQQSIMAFPKVIFYSFLRLNIWTCWERCFSQEMGRSVEVSSVLRENALRFDGGNCKTPKLGMGFLIPCQAHKPDTQWDKSKFVRGRT